ncbi:response regulator [candidate division KSB1 bacterium]|mgnify:CR=1 FL=1|nr:MAG: response regulator [candidate division KSB1 bacterium]RKY85566.1 MAG: response regulator [candidate division KSB1 bacterium]HDI52110.1 response regulator [Bacteroidota bacterium]
MSKVINILVVDDEADFRDIFSEILCQMGYRVVVAKDGAEAIELIKQVKIDIALVDFLMPEMDGVELLRRIKKQTPSTEVILVTGYESVNSVAEAVNQGAYDYITKPIDFGKLEAVIRTIVQSRCRPTENSG